jgi:hypothetical protein
MYVFFDTQCTQEFGKIDVSFEHIPHFICAQRVVSNCEAVDYLNVDLNSMVSVSTCFGRKTRR